MPVADRIKDKNKFQTITTKFGCVATISLFLSGVSPYSVEKVPNTAIKDQSLNAFVSSNFFSELIVNNNN